MVTQLLTILDEWTEALESGGRVDVIYTDFVKAFDKVHHKRLISKLKSYKIRSSFIEWSQRVMVNGQFSCWANVLSGIPRGSILGLLVFIIFINDLVDKRKDNIKWYLFADDAKIYHHIKSNAGKEIPQTGIENFVKWTDKQQDKPYGHDASRIVSGKAYFQL